MRSGTATIVPSKRPWWKVAMGDDFPSARTLILYKDQRHSTIISTLKFTENPISPFIFSINFLLTYNVYLHPTIPPP